MFVGPEEDQRENGGLFIYVLPLHQQNCPCLFKISLILLVLLHLNQYTYLVSSLWFFSRSSISISSAWLALYIFRSYFCLYCCFLHGQFQHVTIPDWKVCTFAPVHSMNSKKTIVFVVEWGSSLSTSFLDRSDPGYSINFDFRGRFDLELSSGCLADYVDLQLWEESTNRYTSYSCTVLLTEHKQHVFSTLHLLYHVFMAV